MSASNAAKDHESEAFDDLLGQLVDELAMAPSIPQPDPAPQLIRPPEPAAHGATYEQPAYQAAVAAPAGNGRTMLAVVGIVAGAAVALGVAGMLILGGTEPGPSETDAAPPSTTEPAAAAPAAPAPVVVAPPAVPGPQPVATPPATPETTPPAVAEAEPVIETPKKRPPKKRPPKKTPPKKTPPKKDSFEDL